LWFAVLCAIHLDDKLRRVVAEIGDVGADWRLLPEVKPMPIELAQLVPELALGSALLVPQAAGPLAHHIRHSALPLTPRPLPS
jgi:hypothetical protein